MITKKAHLFAVLLSIKLKFAAFVLLFFYIIGIFAYTLSSYRSDDPIPDVKVISLKMRKQFRDLTSIVKVGLLIRNFSTLDFINNNFVADAMIWFEFNRDELMLSTIDQFSFENSKIIHKSNPYVTIDGNTMLVKYDIIFDIKTDVNFYRFPLEDHRLSVVLTNNFINPKEMYFDDTGSGLSFVVSRNLFTSNWQVYSLNTLSGYSSVHFDQHNEHRHMLSPKAVFTVNFHKSGINKILLIFVPIFAAVFIALFTFLMSFNSYQGKTTLGVTAVTALLGYRFVIQQMSPPVGYFTLTDKLFIFFLIFSFIIFVFQILLLRHYMFIMERERIKKTEQAESDREFLTPRITERINTMAYFFSIFIFATVVTYFVLM
jgi:hypothetical protein